MPTRAIWKNWSTPRRRPMTELSGPVTATGTDIVPSPSLDQVRECIRASKAENTLRGYQSDWRDFCEWCEGRRVAPLPALPETVAAYIANCAGRLKVGSIQRRLNAITEAHKAVGLECAFAGQEVGFCAKFV